MKARKLCSRHYQRQRTSGDLQKLPLPIVGGQAAEVLAVAYGAACLPPSFWQRVTVLENGCWHWNGAVKTGNYGLVTAMHMGRKRRLPSHRVCYEAFKGAVPDGMVLDHTCHTYDDLCYSSSDCAHRLCCNPNHLEPVTGAENTRRAHFKHKSHCPAGHPYEYPHLAHDRDGYPDCRTCRNRRWRERYWRNKAAGKSRYVKRAG